MEVGTYVDLTYLNKKPKVVQETKPRLYAQSFEEHVGTQLIFRIVNGHFVTARKINVAFG